MAECDGACGAGAAGGAVRGPARPLAKDKRLLLRMRYRLLGHTPQQVH
jgi:hypothetical protein